MSVAGQPAPHFPVVRRGHRSRDEPGPVALLCRMCVSHMSRLRQCRIFRHYRIFPAKRFSQDRSKRGPRDTRMSTKVGRAPPSEPPPSEPRPVGSDPPGESHRLPFDLAQGLRLPCAARTEGRPFAIRHSPFPIPHSPFPIPHSPFDVRRSVFLALPCYRPSPPSWGQVECPET